MCAVVDLRNPTHVEVRVHLRRRQARVSQKLLDAAEIAAALEQVRREAVAQSMGPDDRTRARLAAGRP